MFKDRQPLVDEICKRLSEGEPLAQICRDMHMPGVTTVWEWAKADKSISESIAYARELGFDVIAQDCLDIADDGTNDYAERTGKDGKDYIAFDAEHVQRSKLRVETRLKLLAKWDPKRSGDKQQIEHSGTINTATAILAARKRSGG
jgi:hypothetical protein